MCEGADRWRSIKTCGQCIYAGKQIYDDQRFQCIVTLSSNGQKELRLMELGQKDW